MASSVALESGKVAFQAFWNMPGKQTAAYLGSQVITYVAESIGIVSFSIEKGIMADENSEFPLPLYAANRLISSVAILAENLAFSLSVSVITGALSANPAAGTIAFIATMIITSVYPLAVNLIPYSPYHLRTIFSIPDSLPNILKTIINGVGFTISAAKLGTAFGGVYGGVALGSLAFSLGMVYRIAQFSGAVLLQHAIKENS